MDGVYTLAALPIDKPIATRLKPITGLEGMTAVSLEAELKYGSGGTSCIVRVVSSFDGEHWWDIARFDFGTVSAVKQCAVTDALVGISESLPLNAEGIADRPLLGSMLAVAVDTAGIFVNSAVVVRAASRSGFVRPLIEHGLDWTELELGAALWGAWDLSDLSTLTMDGSSIVAVRDKSNNAHDLAPSGTVVRSASGFNGRGAADWTASGSGPCLVTAAGLLLPQPCTVVSVFQLDNTVQPDYSELWDTDVLATANPRAVEFISRPDVAGSSSIYAGTAVADINAAARLPLNTIYISVTILNGAATQHGYNGASPTTVATNPGSAGLVNGFRMGGNFYGKTGSMAVIDGLLSPGDRQKLEGLYAARFGIA